MSEDTLDPPLVLECPALMLPIATSNFALVQNWCLCLTSCYLDFRTSNSMSIFSTSPWHDPLLDCNDFETKNQPLCFGLAFVWERGMTRGIQTLHVWFFQLLLEWQQRPYSHGLLLRAIVCNSSPLFKFLRHLQKNFFDFFLPFMYALTSFANPDSPPLLLGSDDSSSFTHSFICENISSGATYIQQPEGSIQQFFIPFFPKFIGQNSWVNSNRNKLSIHSYKFLKSPNQGIITEGEDEDVASDAFNQYHCSSAVTIR